MRTAIALSAWVLGLVSGLIGCADGRAPGEIRVLLSDDAFASGVAVDVVGTLTHVRRPMVVDPAVAFVVGRGTRTSLADFADDELVVVLGPRADVVALDERTMRVDLARVEGEPGAVARLAMAIGADAVPAEDGGWELLAPDPWSALAALTADPPDIDRILPVLLDPFALLDDLRIAATPDPAADTRATLGDPTLPSPALLESDPSGEGFARLFDGGAEWIEPRAGRGRGRIGVRAPRPGRFAALSWITGGSGCGMGWTSSSQRQLVSLELGAAGTVIACGEREERAWLGGNAGIDYGEERVRIALAGSWREVERGTVDVELRDSPSACPGAVAPLLAEQELLGEPVTTSAPATGPRRLVLRCASVLPLDDARWGDEVLACRDITPRDEPRAAGGLATGGDLLEGAWVLLGRGDGIAMLGEESFWDEAQPTRVVALSRRASSAAASELPTALGAPGRRVEEDLTHGHCTSFRAMTSPPLVGVIRLGDEVRGPNARARLELLCGR